MTPKKHNDVAGTVELQLTKEPEEIAWLEGHHVEFIPMYMKNVQLRIMSKTQFEKRS